MSLCTEDRISRAKQSVKIPLDPSLVPQQLYDEVLAGVARNVKMGPFKATSGVELPYYLNASTNFLDKYIAPKIVQLVALYIGRYIKPFIVDVNEPFLCVGMEVAGGMLTCQLASANNEDLNAISDFVYIRKDRKATGTRQQLEGPQQFTSRTPDSKPLKALWIDDALSTGVSMWEGIQMLKHDYNIEVVAALYLVDRSEDRQHLSAEKQMLATDVFDNVQIRAIYDLKEVDEVIQKKNSNKKQQQQNGNCDQQGTN